ncbi:MAG TPA: DUF4351 domain-containing protein [Blastocatellia bacterium]
MIDHDRLFKELISTFFLEFLELFLPGVVAYIEASSLQFLDKEIFTDVTSGDRHEVDLLAKLKFKGQDAFFLVHVENQAQAQADFAKRMFRYFARLSERHDLPVYPIALFSIETPLARQEDSYELRFPDWLVLEFHFRLIQLNQLNWREYVRRENPVASALMAKMNIAPEDRPKVKLECARMIASLERGKKLNRAKVHLLLGFIDTYLRLSDEEEKQYEAELEQVAPAERESIMEQGLSWRERAMEEGLRKGHEEGRQEGMALVILQVIEQRLGPVEADLQQQINGLDENHLERLGEVVLKFTSTEDLVAWLKTTIV